MRQCRPVLRSALARIGGGLPATFWWLWGGALVNALGTFVFPFLALFLTARGFELSRVGRIVALFGGGSILSGPFAGFLADRLGRRPTLLLSLGATGLVTAGLAVVSSAGAIAAAALVLGVVSTAFRPAMNAIVADVVPQPERARAFGLVYWANNLGMALALVGGGVLAEHGYGTLFLVDAATTLAFAAIVWREVPETRPAVAAPGGASGSGEPGYAALLADASLLAFLAVNFVFIIVFWQFQVAAPIDMARHGLGPGGFGRVLAVNGFLIAALQPFSSRLTSRFDDAHVLAAASILVGAGYGAYALCTRALHYAAATAVWSLGEILALPVAAALVAELSPAALRGRYQGAYSLSFGIGACASPLIGSLVMHRFGARALWVSCFVLGLAAAAAHVAIARPRRRRRAVLPRADAAPQAASRR